MPVSHQLRYDSRLNHSYNTHRAIDVTSLVSASSIEKGKRSV